MEQQLSYPIGGTKKGAARRMGVLAARHLTLLLLVYGVIVASIGAVQLDRAIHGAGAGLNSERQAGMFASMDVVDAHGPPLTGLASSGGTNFFPIALDDDRGTFIYIPLIAHYAGTHDLNALLKWFFICFFVPLLLVYPLLIHRATESLIVAAASPWLLLANSGFLRSSGIFWVPAWANLLLLPLLLLIAKRWRPSLLWPLIALVVLASFASSMRANAGLGFVFGAILLVLIKMPGWALRLGGAALIVLAYLSISSFGMHAVQVQRDAVVGQDFTSPYPNGHPFWHNGYIGLGYLRNPYGFRPTDAAAIAAAHRKDPGARFPTKRYESALRSVYFDALKQHPWFVVHGWIVKAGVVLGLAAHWYPFAVVLVPLLLLFGRGRRQRRFEFGLTVFAGIVGAATGVFTLPTEIPEIQSGWYGFLLFLWILSLAWVARPLEVAVNAWLREWSAREPEEEVRLPLPWTRALIGVRVARARQRVLGVFETGRRRFREVAASRAEPLAGAASVGILGRVGLAAALAAGVFLANSSGRVADASAAYWANEAPLVDVGSVKGAHVATWIFDGRVADGWRETAARTIGKGNALFVRTRRSAYGLQLSSPARVLEPGHYIAAVDGRVLAGGLQIAAADASIDGSIGYDFYSAQTPFAASRRMALSFDLAEATKVSILLSNFSVLGRPSTWTVRSVSLVREPGGCQFNLPGAYYSPRPAVAQ